VIVAVGAKNECRDLDDGEIEMDLTCPSEEFIRIQSVDVFKWDPNNGHKQCKQTRTGCAVNLLDDNIMQCNHRQRCAVEIKQYYFRSQNAHCFNDGDTNTKVIRVMYNCNRGK